MVEVSILSGYYPKFEAVAYIKRWIPGEYQQLSLNAGPSLINYVIFNPHFHIWEKEAVGLN